MTRLLQDQGAPRSAAARLRSNGLDVSQVGELGMATATDAAIIEFARAHEFVIVTLDADVHGIIAVGGAANPSVIRLREEGLNGADLAALLLRVVERTQSRLASGALVTVPPGGVRVRSLPVAMGGA